MAQDHSKRIKELEAELAERDRRLEELTEHIADLNATVKKILKDTKGEINVLHKIQYLLNPTDLPNISGFDFSSKFIPSTLAGGDYFDIFELQDKFRFAILVASSTSYGASALLLSVVLKFIGQMEAKRGLSANSFLELVDQEISDKIREEDQVSLFYAIVDRRTMGVEYVTTEGMTCYWVDVTDGKVSEIEPTHNPISIDESVEPNSKKMLMGPKDKLVIVTPGVTDAINEVGESFSKSRLTEVLGRNKKKGPHEIRNEILFQIEEFSKGVENRRDKTVLVMEAKNKLLKLARKED